MKKKGIKVPEPYTTTCSKCSRRSVVSVHFERGKVRRYCTVHWDKSSENPKNQKKKPVKKRSIKKRVKR